MELNLVNADRTACALALFLLRLFDPSLQLFEMVHAEIRNTNRADFSILYGLNEGFPGANAAFGAAVRTMQEIQVNVVKPRDFQRCW